MALSVVEAGGGGKGKIRKGVEGKRKGGERVSVEGEVVGRSSGGVESE
jgi:hypothetical protein